jgi:hypothetical protein
MDVIGGEGISENIKSLDFWREIFIVINVLMLITSSVKVLNIMQMFESIGS